VRYEYDERGRLQREHLAGGRSIEHHWDARHRPAGHTAPNGARTRWSQDRLGRIDWHLDALGATTRLRYAGTGPEGPKRGHTQPIGIDCPDGTTLAQAHDREGLLASQTDAAGHTQHWHWGTFDLLTSHTDAAGHTTHYRYDSTARLTELINARGQRWRWHYDTAGRLAEQIDWAGRRTRWERDSLGRPLVRHAPDGTALHYEWDDLDRVREIQAPGMRLRYRYDERDQLVQAQVWRDGQEAPESDLHLAYDAGGRLIEERHRLDGAAPRVLRWRYDEHGQPIARQGPLGETRYAHDALGLLRELHTAQGALVIERDALGQTTRRAGTRVTGQATGFELHQRHDPMGRLLSQHAGNHLQRDYHWQRGRLTGIDDQRFGQVRWQLDAREQVLTAGFENARFGMDDGLLSPDRGSPALTEERFGYDALGNLSMQNGKAVRYGGDTGTGTGIGINTGTDTVTECGDTRYRWDACGRLIERTVTRNGYRPRTWRYEWDALDRLVTVLTPERRRWRYVYDAMGRRRAKLCAAAQAGQHSRAEYLWDGARLAVQWKVFADGTSEAPTSTASAASSSPNPRDEVQEWHFEPGGFEPLGLVQHRAGQMRLLHVVGDLNGAPREVLDQEGTVLWAAQLNTWGQLRRSHLRDRNPSFASHSAYYYAANDPQIEVDLRFANQWADEESGLVYNLNRHYDAGSGQYASIDPIGVAGGIRTHGYTHNPLTWIDPLGLNDCAAKGPIWSSTKKLTPVENALGHWNKHKAEFPELANSKQYVEAAQSLAAHPPAGVLTKSRGAETLIYDGATNTFLVRGADGAPKTMFRPTDGINYWNKQ